MFIIQNWTGAGWVRICSENVRENAFDALREMFFASPGLYRLITEHNKVLAVMGVG
jgi:hypothetical protein